MITLNGVTLSDDLIWEDEFGHAEVSQNVQRTVLGNAVISSFPKTGGKTITLTSRVSGNEYSGYFTRTQIEAFKVLEQNSIPVSFVYEGQNFTVIVQSGGVNVQPLIARPNQENIDEYSGSITLITI